VKEVAVKITSENARLIDVFNEIENKTDFRFVYDKKDKYLYEHVDISHNRLTVENHLLQISKQTKLGFRQVNNNISVKKLNQNQRQEIEIIIQGRIITGKVTSDDDPEGLPGVNVLLKGSSTGSVTDIEGNFTLEVPDENSVLVFSSVGYLQQEVTVGNQSVINLKLSVDVTTLGEIVVIGYGTQQKKDITGAVASVKSENFNKGIRNSPAQLLQGKVSGVSVTASNGAPGSGQRIIIRGQGTIREGSGPLFVIDGFPIATGGSGGTYDFSNFINPEDIASMDVLKDASATAIYGSRGANGVILITTKKGSAGLTMAPNVSLSSNIGISTMAKKLPVYSADEFRQKVVEIGGILTDRGANTDWQDELTRTAITQDHNLIMSGGTNDFTYRASLGYLDQEGIVMNTGFKRFSGRVNANQKLMDGRLNIDFNLNSTIETGENAHLKTVVAHMLTYNPTYSAYTDGEPTKHQDFINPIHQAELYKDFNEIRRTIVNIAPSFEIIDGLVYKLNLGFVKRSHEIDRQEMPSVDPFVQGRLQQDNSNYSNTLIENYLTYTKDFNNHSLILLGGYSYQKTTSKSSSWNILQFEANGIEPRFNPGLGQLLDLTSNRPSGSAQENELQSFFGRANYSFKGKYLLTGTVRADGSSKFGENNKYGTFPSFAAGWRISDEAFMGSNVFSELKLRAGWGQTGNQEIPNKITQESFRSSTGGDDTYPLFPTGPYPVGTVYTRLANPDIQWEVSTQTNVGLDFGLFDGALSGTIDYFHKVSNNILVEVPAFDPVSPAPTYWTNVPDMIITNNGLEIALDYRYENESGFSYSVGANATFINNVVEDSPFNVLTTGSVSGSGQTGATINGMINGHPLGSFYLQKFTGIDDGGLSTYEPPLVTDGDNRYVVGKALPDLTYNLYADLGYKGFDFSLSFNGVSGVEIFNHTALQEFSKPQLASNWNVVPKAVEFPDEAITNAPLVSTRYLEDGSFFRLNYLTFGYTFNTDALSWLKVLRLSFTGQNLFVITDYSGYDPEVNQDKSIGGVQSFGIDHQSYPRARTYVFGLNVTF
ncbi:MAG: TonB-dependent receptor, partial [Cyclobacteriaceae bacterium]|nr:TonB-dependent receptor [Cyclobacteriaceae bacterium]